MYIKSYMSGPFVVENDKFKEIKVIYHMFGLSMSETGNETGVDYR